MVARLTTNQEVVVSSTTSVMFLCKGKNYGTMRGPITFESSSSSETLGEVEEPPHDSTIIRNGACGVLDSLEFLLVVISGADWAPESMLPRGGDGLPGLLREQMLKRPS